MNLVEKLLVVDKGEFDKIERKEIPSRQLSKLVGAEAKVVIQAIDGDYFSALSASGLDERMGRWIIVQHFPPMPKLPLQVS